MSKKEILFVIPNLNVGGAEKALVSLLNLFDFDKYNVDLLLFKQEGAFLKDVPKEVNLLPEPISFKYFDMPFLQVVKFNLQPKQWRFIIKRLQYKQQVLKAKTIREARQLGWYPIAKTLEPLEKKYDVAIGYLQSWATYYVVDKVNAQNKIGFIHTHYTNDSLNEEIENKYFKQLNYIPTITESSQNVLKTNFPTHDKKFVIIKNIVSKKLILKNALHPITVQHWKKETFNIVSVGRLEDYKGYDLAYEGIVKVLTKYKNVNWYILGDGSQMAYLKNKIKLDALDNRIFLLGTIENPYPYMLASDVFLHSAKFEGDGLVVREAKALAKPIVLTKFNTASSHIKNGINGIIVGFNASEIANALEQLLLDSKLRESFIKSLSNESWHTEDSIKEFYKIIDN